MHLRETCVEEGREYGSRIVVVGVFEAPPPFPIVDFTCHKPRPQFRAPCASVFFLSFSPKRALSFDSQRVSQSLLTISLSHHLLGVSLSGPPLSRESGHHSLGRERPTTVWAPTRSIFFVFTFFTKFQSSSRPFPFSPLSSSATGAATRLPQQHSKSFSIILDIICLRPFDYHPLTFAIAGSSAGSAAVDQARGLSSAAAKAHLEFALNTRRAFHSFERMSWFCF